LTTGARLGPYEILSALGAGGMGEVYRARDTRLDRTVAIKVLPAGLSGDPDLRARFEHGNYAVTRDGERFVVKTGDGPGAATAITVVSNWTALLKK